jgi:hypothetical protein
MYYLSWPGRMGSRSPAVLVARGLNQGSFSGGEGRNMRRVEALVIPEIEEETL